MKSCDRFDEFMSSYGNVDQQEAFEAHLAVCPDCATALSELNAIEKELFVMAAQGAQDLQSWSPGARQRLIERAAAPRRWLLQRAAVLRWAAVSVTMIAVVVGAFWGVILLSRQGETDRGPVAENDPGVALSAQLFLGTGVEPVAVSYKPRMPIRSPIGGRILIHVGEDRIGLDGGGEFRLVEVDSTRRRISLERGTVACFVSHRTRGGEFVVEAGRIEARVVGTRFAITRTDAEVEVLVSEGQVEVTAPEQEAILVAAGEVLIFSAGGEAAPDVLDDGSKELIEKLLSDAISFIRHSPKGDGGQRQTSDVNVDDACPPSRSRGQATADERDVTAKDLDTLRGWVIEGRLKDATRGLRTYLKQKPKDPDAWLLMADCQRKAGGWAQAVEAYRQVIAVAPLSRADLARFRAGAILQEKLGNHREAVKMFKAYLQSGDGKKFRAEAMVRLGRSLLVLGRRGEASRTLEEVVELYGGNPAVIEARDLLESLGNEKMEHNTDLAQ